MIELSTFIAVLFILLCSMFGFQILIYLELRDIERRKSIIARKTIPLHRNRCMDQRKALPEINTRRSSSKA